MSAQDELGLVERLRAHADDCERLSMPEGRPALSREAAATLTSLIAERDGLAKWKDQLLLDEKAQRLAREAAEAQLKAAREASEALNVTDAELVRIHNMCTGFDGDVKIWSKMLHKLAVFAIAARTALYLDSNKGDGV